MHFSIDLQPFAHRPARMEVPVQLQTAALVLVGGLDGHVKKVWTAITYILQILGWHHPCLWTTLLKFVVCMRENFGRGGKCICGHALSCHVTICMRENFGRGGKCICGHALSCHVTISEFSNVYIMAEGIDGSISLTCVFPFCSKAICSETCQNGGTCSSPDTCSCVHGWTGSTCSEVLWNVCRPESPIMIILLSLVFFHWLQPYALASARTEVPVQLQMAAPALVGGLGALAVKVCDSMHDQK